jgi:hypothetical protein
MPRNAEIWLGNKKLLVTDFPIENLKLGERINLMIKGDPEENRRMAWKTFYKAADIERKWLKENAWNSNKKIYFKGLMVKRDNLQKEL